MAVKPSIVHGLWVMCVAQAVTDPRCNSLSVLKVVACSWSFLLLPSLDLSQLQSPTTLRTLMRHRVSERSHFENCQSRGHDTPLNCKLIAWHTWGSFSIRYNAKLLATGKHRSNLVHSDTLCLSILTSSGVHCSWPFVKQRLTYFQLPTHWSWYSGSPPGLKHTLNSMFYKLYKLPYSAKRDESHGNFF